MLGSILYYAKTTLFSIAAIFGLVFEEQPEYAVIDTLDNKIEIRLYAPRLVAETTVKVNENADGEAFGRLAGYIFGDNVSGVKVAMTTPVEIDQSDAAGAEPIAMTSPVEIDETVDGYTMRFFLPSKYTLETAPTPLDQMVVIRMLPETLMAARRYRGGVDPNEANKDAFTADLLATPYTPKGIPSLYGYNPPWTIPLLKRTDVVVEVARRDDRAP